MRCLLLRSTRKAFRGNFYGSHGFIVGYSLERIITKLVELCVNNDILVRNKSDIQSAVLYSVLGILIANQISQLMVAYYWSPENNSPSIIRTSSNGITTPSRMVIILS